MYHYIHKLRENIDFKYIVIYIIGYQKRCFHTPVHSTYNIVQITILYTYGKSEKFLRDACVCKYSLNVT